MTDAPDIADDLAAPYPHFGGKRRAASIIWKALGRVKNFVDPFFGSGAVLLSRPRECWATPDDPGTETVNDLSRMLANFWRALAADPDAVAAHADYPVNETDLHARHRWLMNQLSSDFAARMDADPDYFDVKVAGRWVWGACAWIGSGWCDEERARRPGRAPQAGGAAPDLGNAGQGVHRRLAAQLPHLGNAGQGLSQQIPYLGGGDGGTGRGINRKTVSDAGDKLHLKLPHVGDGGRGEHRAHREGLRAYLCALAARTRGVRVACGDWSRVTGDSVTWRHGLTGMVLDPPYAEGNQQYAAGGTGTSVSADARVWAIEAGKRPDMRIVFCEMEGGVEPFPADRRCVAWKARGGYGSQSSRGNDNRTRERLWLSPACLGADYGPLFAGGAR